MSWRRLVIAGFVVVTVVAVGALWIATPAAATERTDAARPAIVELYPNPATAGDEGEFVTLWIPETTRLDAYALADGDERVSLASASERVSTVPSAAERNGNAGRYVTFSTAPNQTRALTNRTVVRLSSRLQLANGGERLRLLGGEKTVDVVTYQRAPEAEVYDASTDTWAPLGATDRPVVTARGGTVEAFVLPDEPERARTLLDSAEDRILLAGYTLSSPTVVEALESAHDRGVTVRVLVEAGPVGGMTGQHAAALDELARAGIPVRVVGGERARYRYHHAKYAVVDDRALVTSENWKPAGLGGASSRGWGVVTGQDRIVEGLAATYRADAGWVDAIPWTEYDDRSLVSGDRAESDYPQTFAAEAVPVEETHLLVAPDNAARTLRERIAGASQSLDVVQVSVSDTGMPFLQALLDAARRGVRVRLLLSSAWYVEEENRQLKTWLDEQAAAEDLPLTVRIADPADSFEKIHAKGVIVDGDEVLVGSINWSNTSIRENREVALLLEGEAVAGYFEDVFESDWGNDGWLSSHGTAIPVGYLVIVAVVVLCAVVGARRLRFE